MPLLRLTASEVAKLKRIETWALDLLRVHRLWPRCSFRYNCSRTYLGWYDDCQKSISLSVYFVLMNNKKEIEKVLLHEIAHALTPRERKPHGVKWKKVAQAIGADVSAGCGIDNDYKMPPRQHVAYCFGCNIKRESHYNIRQPNCKNCGKEYTYVY